ncbi:transaldolase family protein [Streptomyces sp. AP-93]|uniref:transaldolase family protein n=1 Tax=Streptomyces sp. AP-93 TaxID=2929048 RepID=UPI001FAFDEBC|nr:transaldolase family protein [Streptomyces sp. AP-93]MCJ0871922.1 transaldolase [Streptomyces sp. AP-93]
MNNTVARLSAQGVSLWLDGSGGALGDLRGLTGEGGITGIAAPWSPSARTVRTDPACHERLDAWTDSTSPAETLWELAVEDARQLCDQLLPTHRATAGREGFVSVDVDPRNAWDAGATLAEARALWSAVDRPNLMVRIPATVENLSVMTACLAESMNVNATLIFSPDRAARVARAFLDGLDQASGPPAVSAVASFSVSELDAEVDRVLERAGTAEARALTGTSAIANARLGYESFQQVFASPRWRALAEAGATEPRLLWASTAVRHPEHRHTRYVEELIAPGTVHTVSEGRLRAVLDDARIHGDSVRRHYADARRVLSYLQWFGISHRTVAASLHATGLRKAIAEREELLSAIAVSRPHQK